MMFTSESVAASGLVRKGEQAQASSKRAIQIDYSDRIKVIDALSASLMELRRARIGSAKENLFWELCNRAKI